MTENELPEGYSIKKYTAKDEAPEGKDKDCDGSE